MNCQWHVHASATHTKLSKSDVTDTKNASVTHQRHATALGSVHCPHGLKQTCPLPLPLPSQPHHLSPTCSCLIGIFFIVQYDSHFKTISQTLLLLMSEQPPMNSCLTQPRHCMTRHDGPLVSERVFIFYHSLHVPLGMMLRTPGERVTQFGRH